MATGRIFEKEPRMHFTFLHWSSISSQFVFEAGQQGFCNALWGRGDLSYCQRCNGAVRRVTGSRERQRRSERRLKIGELERGALERSVGM